MVTWSADCVEPYALEEQHWRLVREVTVLRTLARAGCPGVPDHDLCAEAGDHPWYVMPFYPVTRGGR